MNICIKQRTSWPQFMAGGDLGAAIKHDVLEHGTGLQRRLSWYNRGRVVLLWVVRGLVYLHHCRVRKRLNGYMQPACAFQNIRIYMAVAAWVR